jgi:hypothetical protein
MTSAHQTSKSTALLFGKTAKPKHALLDKSTNIDMNHINKALAVTSTKEYLSSDVFVFRRCFHRKAAIILECIVLEVPIYSGLTREYSAWLKRMHVHVWCGVHAHVFLVSFLAQADMVWRLAQTFS